MTPEQQRIAIAEACGWEKLYKGPEPDNRWMSPNRRYCTDKDIPDFLNDLNAMHDAEKVLISRGGLPTYEHFLRFNEFKEDSLPWYGSVHATAAQRAEAFLRTIGKWIE